MSDKRPRHIWNASVCVAAEVTADTEADARRAFEAQITEAGFDVHHSDAFLSENDPSSAEEHR